MKQRATRGAIAIVALIILLVIDRVTKLWAVINLKGHDAIIVIKDVFRLNYLENRGAAFGILQGKQMLLLLITIVVLGFLVYAYIKVPITKRYLPLRISFIGIAAGAVGNLYDRFFYNYVVDFLEAYFIDFPIFNIADCYVVVSVILLFFVTLIVYKESDFDFMKRK